GFSPQDLEGPVDLFQEKKAEQLVGKGQAGEGEARVGPFQNLLRKAGGPADDKDHFFPGHLPFAEPGGEFFRGVGFAAAVKGDQVGGGAGPGKNPFPLNLPGSSSAVVP